VEQLSRRLHQFGVKAPGRKPGAFSLSFLFSEYGVTMPYRTVKTLSPVDAAYMAGLIDGEGTVTLSRRHRDDQRQLVVSIANTGRGLLEWALGAAGAGKITGKRISSPLHSPSFTYSIANRQALQLLEQIAPFLRSYKAIRTKLILQHYINLTPRNGRYTEKILAERNRFLTEVLEIKGSWTGTRLSACRAVPRHSATLAQIELTPSTAIALRFPIRERNIDSPQQGRS